ncbi:hypothetical protein [uncultured Paludibaculum sp.]|uniref:hypothetical protein n=1 Tax=uncultured Paludibaculum sp. TaxID=1765020 RepID=UPI002AAACF38|nr:hypothetical protein [uncultured Paludibaculum sp.]
MPLFWTEFVWIPCSDLAAQKRWWILSFDCKECPVPQDWDDPLPLDVALRLPGHDAPTILLRDRREVQRAGGQPATERALIFCANLKKARGFLQERGAQPGPTQSGGGTEFFELFDPESNAIEICKEP